MNIPIATYRLQFNSSFGFRAANEILDYLKQLGVTHVYASPILKARKTSAHGYDGVDPGLLNPLLGSQEDFETLINQLKKLNMGWVQDIVPNHLAYDFDKSALRDLLELGPNSSYRYFFDTDLQPVCTFLEGKLSAPFLGDHYEKCLLDGQIRLNFNEEGFSIRYYEFKLPLALASYGELLDRVEEEMHKKHEKATHAIQQFTDMAARFKTTSQKGPNPERDNLITELKAELWKLYQEQPDITLGLDGMIETINGNPEDKQSFLGMHKLLEAQFFRLRFWKTAGEEINYRRFFDINDLIALRQERDPVFLWSHQLLLSLFDEKIIDGFRVDHIDGLVNPADYLTKLRKAAANAYLIVEKILEHNEYLPDPWPIQGTTGYEFSYHVESLFVRGDNEKAMKSILTKYTSVAEPFEKILVSAKKLILSTHFMGDLDNLVGSMQKLAMNLPSGADITRSRLKAALIEFLIRFPVYRTYAGSENITPEDKTYIHHTISLGTLHRPDLLYEFEFLQKILLKTYDVSFGNEKVLFELRRRAVTQLEQLTAPLMAKGLEDTSLYRYPLLLSLNEVGGVPDRLGNTRRSFHEFMKERSEKWPYSMSSSSTHDSKRGEDIRARLNVLSEIPDQWEKRVSNWYNLNREKKIRLNEVLVPDNVEEYFIYQTLVGFWPLEADTDPPYAERLENYMVKCLREAKIHSSWHSPDEKYEAGVISFLRGILDQSGSRNLFMEEFVSFCRTVAYYGFFNSLSISLIKIAAPGVPDCFQGSELMNLNLVDPDNRRPVDYEKRKMLMRKIREASCDGRMDPFPEPLQLVAAADRLKLFLITKSLEVRKQYPRLFLDGSYIPVNITGRFSWHVVAFARQLENQWSIVAVPRFLAGLITPQQTPLGSTVWEDTAAVLPPGAPSRWQNALTGQDFTLKNNLPMGELFQMFPGALLTGGRK